MPKKKKKFEKTEITNGILQYKKIEAVLRFDVVAEYQKIRLRVNNFFPQWSHNSGQRFLFDET